MEPDEIARALATRLHHGEADAVRDLYRAYGKLVFTIARRIVEQRELAEEATQQAFVQIWRAAGTVEPDRDIRPLLFTIARRAAIDVLRREQRRRHEELDETTAGSDGVEEVERVWLVWRVREALDRLPAEDRVVAQLQHRAGLSLPEIAEKLAIPLGTVKSRSFRAHRRLAAMLQELREEVS